MDSRKKRDGKYLDLVGNYDPLQDPAAINVDKDRAVSWMQKGAILSDTVRQIFKKQGVI